MVRGFGAALVAAGVALPWVVVAEVEPPVVSAPVEPPVQPAPAGEPASGTQIAAATVMRPALVHVAGGTFLMGSPPGEEGRLGDETQHRVQVSSFLMCETEVTQAQFVAVAGSLPAGCGSDCGDTLPAHSISWFDAADYLDALSRKEGLRPCYAGREGETVSWDRSCDGYRLPTEAEWEFAARAGTSTAYSFGDGLVQLPYHAWYHLNSKNRPHPVGTLQPNPWRLFDMYGNVWEWVWDGFDERYGLDVTQLTDVKYLTIDPGGPVPIVGLRVLRGGSFDVEPGHLRSADRDWRGSSNRVRPVGFRCVRAARPQP